MKKKTVTKLWKNIFASIRDYEVEDAIKLGELLTNVKQQLPHGTFLNWINDNCNFSLVSGVLKSWLIPDNISDL